MLAPTYINGADEKLLKRLIAQELDGKILDVGCGEGRVKAYLPPSANYTGMDARPGKMVDIVSDIHKLPFSDNSFDGVICASVLEHVEDYQRVVREIYRVLRVGGKAVITIPFLVHYHRDPDDYVRLTHRGLELLLTRQGFSKVTTFRNNGVFAVIEFALFCVLVHARREELFIKKWWLLPYYVIVGILMVFFRTVNYVIAPIEHHDTSLYVGVAAVATK